MSAGRAYADRSEVRRRSGYLVIAEARLFGGGGITVFWHRLESRAKARLRKLRARAGNVYLERITGGPSP